MLLEGKSVVITGACSGVGVAVLLRFAREVCASCAPTWDRSRTSAYPTPPTTGMGEVDRDEEAAKRVSGYHPVDRPITAAEAALFLAWGAAKNITGVLLPLNGGHVAQ
jgi:NAD(P)-dependent dehydrogenase (short-subunit alcohol dehydrogenase family)